MGCLHWQHSCGRAVRRSGQRNPADKQTPVNTASWNGLSCGISPRVGPVNPRWSSQSTCWSSQSISPVYCYTL